MHNKNLHFRHSSHKMKYWIMLTFVQSMDNPAGTLLKVKVVAYNRKGKLFNTNI